MLQEAFHFQSSLQTKQEKIHHVTCSLVALENLVRVFASLTCKVNPQGGGTSIPKNEGSS